MPDADKVHKRLRFEQQRVYKQICEDVLSVSEIAHAELDVMKRLLNKFGMQPIWLIDQAAKLIISIPTEPLLRSTVDWTEKFTKLESLEQQVLRQHGVANKRATTLALDACKDQLYEIEQGRTSHNLKTSILFRYMVRVYEAEFEGRVQLAHHYKDVSHELVSERIQAMRPYIEKGLHQFAEQVARQGSMERLRRPTRPSIPSIQLHDNLLIVGKIA